MNRRESKRQRGEDLGREPARILSKLHLGDSHE
jgi:hypothetical protein